jgi:prepilin-type N-terminal cleavage/methylation domain-containing protein
MKNVYKQKRQEGFTIIEVLIVLAIAALILLIVFLAVPALQRNARNTQRKSDVANLASAVTNFEGNNSGAIPTASGYDANEPQSQMVFCKGAAQPLNGGVTATQINTFAGATLYGCLTSNRNFDSSKMGYYKPENKKVFIDSSNAAVTIVDPGLNSESISNISTNSIIMEIGYQCNSSNNGIGTSNNRSVALLYVTEASSGFGNLQCIQA